MSNEAIKELADQLADLRLKLNEKDTKITELSTKVTALSGVNAQFTALKDTVKQTEIKNHRGSIEGALEALVKSQDILPAVREKFTRVYKVADDDHVMDVTLEDVTSFAKENANPHKKRETKKIVALSRADGDVPSDTPADNEVVMRVEAQLRSEGKGSWTSEEFQSATVRMFKANPDLGTRYKHSVNVAIDHPSARS